MKRIKLTVMVAAILVVVGCLILWHRKRPEPGGRIISGASYTGIILTHGDWRLSEQDVAIFEHDFAEAIRTDARLQGTLLAQQEPRFWRYYNSILKDGRRGIAVSFFHKDYVTEHAWRLPLRSGGLSLVVGGGGEGFWNLTYDVEKRTFTDIRHNSDM